MLLRMERGLRGIAALALGAMLVLAGFARPATAMTYEAEPSFCQGATLRDYLAPLDRLPKLHGLPTSGQMGFSSHNIVAGQGPELVVGEGNIGFWLNLHNYSHPAHVNWEVIATLTEVDWRGRPIRTVDHLRRRLHQLGREYSADFEFPVSDPPAVYRVTAIFHSLSGRKLGGFGSYFRVVPATKHARYGLNSNIYHPGQTVFGRVEDFGTMPAAYGVPYWIERLDGTTWTKAPESPRGPWIMPLLYSGSGMAGKCDGFRIPTTMPPGRYRMAKENEYVNWPARFGRHQTTLTAEFEVSP
jgi:hypothetical protein